MAHDQLLDEAKKYVILAFPEAVCMIGLYLTGKLAA